MKKLLLHVCCAPCLVGCMDVLKEYETTLFFYNPNIHPSGEYLKRLYYVKKTAQELGIPLIIGNYEFNEFFENTKGLEQEKENGKRCDKCFELRMTATAMLAKQEKFDCFTTTMTVSPHKNFETIKKISEDAAKKVGTNYLPKDFKQKEGYKKSTENSKRMNIYRQNYCGCFFSLDNTTNK